MQCLQLTETFIFRRWLRLASRKSLESFFVSLFKTAAQQGGKLDETVGKLMADPSTGMATDEQVRSSFETMSFNYSNVRQVAMRNFVLARLEEGAAQSQGADPVPLIDLMWSDPNRFSCEHIMPQKLSPAWRKDLGAEADKFHALWLHRIANLTLTSHNAEYGNNKDSWPGEGKIAQYTEHTGYQKCGASYNPRQVDKYLTACMKQKAQQNGKYTTDDECNHSTGDGIKQESDKCDDGSNNLQGTREKIVEQLQKREHFSQHDDHDNNSNNL